MVIPGSFVAVVISLALVATSCFSMAGIIGPGYVTWGVACMWFAYLVTRESRPGFTR